MHFASLLEICDLHKRQDYFAVFSKEGPKMMQFWAQSRVGGTWVRLLIFWHPLTKSLGPLLGGGRTAKILVEVITHASRDTHSQTKRTSGLHTGRAHGNSNADPLMLLTCGVNTPIHTRRFYLLCVALRVLCA